MLNFLCDQSETNGDHSERLAALSSSLKMSFGGIEEERFVSSFSSFLRHLSSVDEVLSHERLITECSELFFQIDHPFPNKAHCNVIVEMVGLPFNEIRSRAIQEIPKFLSTPGSEFADRLLETHVLSIVVEEGDVDSVLQLTRNPSHCKKLASTKWLLPWLCDTCISSTSETFKNEMTVVIIALCRAGIE